ncbi:T9SS type A sorting domain-containing protein [Aquimarina sp. ERC-38]|uniref:T9SS type A sorting domain-containing protein n=1 Tax=Aquimarina sp. ERC-38 TaxID=2949996 RepID=UPI0022474BF9|nr:T9SS type A sorting domain-containing protein [Aquimarina sp. ERC-38]UZO79734.1 T9SS type A sorting domain-containing protein [Aquimarina sp. ERC-38]
MKTTKFLGVLFIIAFNLQFLTAQNAKSRCLANAEAICNLGSSISLIDRKQYDILVDELSSCSLNNAVTLYAQSLLILNTSHLNGLSGERRERGYRYLKKAAALGYEKADIRLAISYMTNTYLNKFPFQDGGIKAQEIFQKYPNNSIAQYGLGYIALKNLGQREITGYPTAKKYFLQSGLPMANYWLGIMQYFGYGFTPDKALGLDMIKKSGVAHAQEVYDFLKKRNPSTIDTKLTDRNTYDDIIAYEDRLFNRDITSVEFLNKRMTGEVMERTYDNKYELRRSRITIRIESDMIQNPDGSYNVEISTGYLSLKNHKTRGKLNGNIISINQDAGPVSISFRDADEWNPFVKNNFYGMTDFRIMNIPKTSPWGTTRYVIESMRTYDSRNAEKGVRLMLFTSILPDISFGLGAKNALNTANNFAKVHPNPFTNSFSVSYNLDTSSKVRIEIFDLMGNKVIGDAKEVEKQKGLNTATFNSSKLLKGNHIIRFTINGEVFTQTITKI